MAAGHKSRRWQAAGLVASAAGWLSRRTARPRVGGSLRPENALSDLTEKLEAPIRPRSSLLTS